MHTNSIVVLGIDPGSSNCAFGVVRVQAKPFRYTVLEHGMVLNTVRSLIGSDIRKTTDLFQREIRKIIRKHSATHLIAERFQTRGNKGVTIELVNVMLGLLLGVGVKHAMFITASQWKNEWNREEDLNEFYETCGVVAHQADAVNIAMYGASTWLKIEHFQNTIQLPTFRRRLKLADIGNYKEVSKAHAAEKKAKRKPKRRSTTAKRILKGGASKTQARAIRTVRTPRRS